MTKTILNFQISNEIVQAKNVLWAIYIGLGNKKACRNSQARSHHAVGLDLIDMLDAFKKIDGNKLGVPFVAVRMDRLPRNGPEEINVFSLVDRLSAVERELNTIRTEDNTTLL